MYYVFMQHEKGGMKMKIGERGQVTIPKTLRDRYGLAPGMEVEFAPEESSIRIQKKARHLSPVREVYGILKAPGSTDDYMEAVRGR
jgi:AbrB family looped-hinge helix DNA binding protein